VAGVGCSAVLLGSLEGIFASVLQGGPYATLRFCALLRSIFCHYSGSCHNLPLERRAKTVISRPAPLPLFFFDQVTVLPQTI